MAEVTTPGNTASVTQNVLNTTAATHAQPVATHFTRPRRTCEA
jgi:hypothetical protein